MAHREQVPVDSTRSSRRADESALLEFKLHPPAMRAQSVVRARLLDILAASDRASVITLVAPAGYGKTTLLAQWARRTDRPVAWLSLDRADMDPSQLLFDVAAALRSSGLSRGPKSMSGHLTEHTAISLGVSRVIRMIEPSDERGVLILDHMEKARSRAVNDVIAELVHRLDGRLQVAVASRKKIRLPIGVWRSEGRLLELGPAELRMDETEADALLRGMDVVVEQLPDLVERTEGWPVVLYLVGLAIRSDSSGAGMGIRGDDRFVADYMREQILSGLPRGTLQFLTHTAILDQLSGPLCDSVLQRRGSSKLLSSLEEANLPIVPLDHTRSWYRYHQLLQDLLISELEAREPEAVSRLHGRASRWFIRNDMPELAIHHARAIGDHETVADIIGEIGRVSFSSGRASAVLGWLVWLEGTGQLDRYPGVAALGALAFSLVGDSMKADRFAGYIIGDHETPEPEVHVSAVALLVRSLQARHGLTQSRRDAALAMKKLPPGSDWLPPVLLASALPSIWEGELDVAEPLLAQAITTGESLTASLVSPFALAERAVIAAARDDWDEAEEYTNRSLQLIRDQGIEEYVTSGLTFVMSARCSRRNGDLARAKTLLARAARLRPVLNATLPGISAQTLLEQARAYLDLGDVAAARTAMREAEDVIRQRPALGLLPDQLDEMKAGLDSMGLARVGAFTLTKAELRLLPLLSSHLTFPEIGERLYVSRHTVKTQAMSIYRKLGASSRSEAVDKARAAGFLSD